MTETHRMLQSDHADIRALIERLRDAVDSTEPAPIQLAWSELEPRLLAHIDEEERHLLPGLEETHRADVIRTRKEHDRIRTLLANLGVHVDLHALRKTAAEALLAELEAHATREDATLYRWAEQEVKEGERRALRDALHRVRGLLGRT